MFFVTKVNPSGSALAYSTYLGGSTDDFAGESLWTVRAMPMSPGQHPRGFHFLTRFRAHTAAARKMVSSRRSIQRVRHWYTLVYLGGNASDGVSAIAIDAASNAYVTGATRSTNFPYT
jgi:hypothetical protein